MDYLLADPPWNYDDRRPRAASQVSGKYEVLDTYEKWADVVLSAWGSGHGTSQMTNNGYCAAYLLSACDKTVSTVFMWCTWSMLEEVVSTIPKAHQSVPPYDCNFSLRTVITWIKLKNRGGLKFGLGNSTRGVTEPLLVYVRKDAKPPHLQIPNIFSEYSGPRTRKPKLFERKLVELLGGTWAYMFSGPETAWAKGLDIDLIDGCHDFSRRHQGLFRT